MNLRINIVQLWDWMLRDMSCVSCSTMSSLSNYKQAGAYDGICNVMDLVGRLGASGCVAAK